MIKSVCCNMIGIITVCALHSALNAAVYAPRPPTHPHPHTHTHTPTHTHTRTHTHTHTHAYLYSVDYTMYTSCTGVLLIGEIFIERPPATALYSYIEHWI